MNRCRFSDTEASVQWEYGSPKSHSLSYISTVENFILSFYGFILGESFKCKFEVSLFSNCSYFITFVSCYERAWFKLEGILQFNGFEKYDSFPPSVYMIYFAKSVTVFTAAWQPLNHENRLSCKADWLLYTNILYMIIELRLSYKLNIH